ncbi:hypothetical protein BN1221_01045 [Brenneria goodwinii]|uniref:Uncharacterized protein n=1 Tax=Brenneria goodwinii TaxID=1109412 RepID=A0A0G4JRT6_9GAMM|nr:hypothetical protein BN1221_01045 [Brenneria goodwinii]
MRTPMLMFIRKNPNKLSKLIMKKILLSDSFIYGKILYR